MYEPLEANAPAEETDEQLAQRLQSQFNREFIAQQPGFGGQAQHVRGPGHVPLLDDANDNFAMDADVNGLPNVGGGEEEFNVEARSPKWFYFLLAWASVEIFFSCIVLWKDYDAPCDFPLALWLIIWELRFVMVLPLSWFHSQRAYRSKVRGLRSVSLLLQCVWFILGQGWVLDCDTCQSSAPSLYIYTLTLTILAYILVALCFLLFAGFCLCYPILLAFRIMPSRPGGEHIGGANEMSINAIPSRTYHAPVDDGIIPDNDETDPDEMKGADVQCAICMEDFQAGDELRTLPCEHEFHSPCVDRWLRQKHNCPLCRQSIFPDANAQVGGLDI